MTTEFGKRLKLARQKEGLRLDELVDKIDKKVNKQTLSKYERGEMMPSSDVLCVLIKALNVSLDFLCKHTIKKIIWRGTPEWDSLHKDRNNEGL